MPIHKLFQCRSILFVCALLLCLLVLIHIYSTSSQSKKISLSNHPTNYILKILEINDREPTYKLATYEGYQFPLARNRAQTKVFDYLKLYKTCQENPKTIVVDIGASLGEFGLYAAACGCQVYMFEIEPMKMSLIEKSIKLNSFESKIHLIKKAVSDVQSNNKIYFSKNSSSQIFNLNNPNIYHGETINLNQFEFPSQIYLFRVDVQGYELNVFRSTEKLFREHFISHVILEYTPWGTDKPIQKDLFHYLKDILGAKAFFALHPTQPIIYGPLNDQDINEFYSLHSKQHLQRDVYVLFQDQPHPLASEQYHFQSSF